MLPKTIKILGHRYPVKKRLRLVEKHATTGRLNTRSNQIEYDARMPESAQQEVILHECIEALNSRLGWELPHSTIAALGETLNQVLADNDLGYRH